MIAKKAQSTETLIVEGNTLSYILVRSKKRKRSLSMKVRKDGNLQINVPFFIEKAVVEDFILSKYSWLKQQKQRAEHEPQKSLSYENGDKHLYLGEYYPLQLITSKISKVEISNGFLCVFHRKNASIKNLVLKWYRQQALDYFNHRTHLFKNSNNLPEVKKVKVRNMKARWGSCSSRAVITYNIHLLKASTESIDYVIIHELCHLIHPNHSHRFYQLQSQLNPNWKQQKKSLNNLGYKYICD